MPQIGNMVAFAMRRVAAGAHLPTPWLYEPAERPDDRADYCLDCSYLIYYITLSRPQLMKYEKLSGHTNEQIASC